MTGRPIILIIFSSTLAHTDNSCINEVATLNKYLLLSLFIFGDKTSVNTDTNNNSFKHERKGLSQKMLKVLLI